VYQISIWGDTLSFQYEPLPYLKVFWSSLLTAMILKIFCRHYKHRNFIVCHPLFSIVAVRWTTHKTGVCVFTCLSWGGEGLRRKIDDHTVSVAANSQIVISWVGIFRVFFNTMSETKPKCCQPKFIQTGFETLVFASGLRSQGLYTVTEENDIPVLPGHLCANWTINYFYLTKSHRYCI
jgi:hypothetical protein